MSVTVVISHTSQVLEVADKLIAIVQVDPTLIKPLVILATLPFVLYFIVVRPVWNYQRRIRCTRSQTTQTDYATTDSGFQTNHAITHNLYGVIYQANVMQLGLPHRRAKQIVYRNVQHLQEENRVGVEVNPIQHINLSEDLERGTYEEYRFLHGDPNNPQGN